MIIVGTIAAIITGCGLPVHMILFGDIIDQFISYSLAGDLNLTGNNSFSMFSANSSNGSSYFCDIAEDQSSLFNYIVSDDPSNLLQMLVGSYSIYYVILASGLLIASFLSIVFWNISAYRQTRRMRTAFFYSIMKQNIGWFDVNPSSELSTRLIE